MKGEDLPVTRRRSREFDEQRERLNRVVMKYAGLGTKRFFGLDDQVYRPGALPAGTKELLGLVASLALRCDDCIAYHLIRCRREGITAGELEEALAVGLVVGGSIIIPHLRRAWDLWDELEKEETGGAEGR